MLFRSLTAGVFLLGTTACAVSPFTVSSSYPVHGNPVNPTPMPTYRVACSTGYGLGVLLLPSRTGYCRGETAPVVVQEAIRVRG